MSQVFFGYLFQHFSQAVSCPMQMALDRRNRQLQDPRDFLAIHFVTIKQHDAGPLRWSELIYG